MADPAAAGRFVWYDLLTTAPDRAIDFYGKVAGWGTEPWEHQSPSLPPYTMWTVGSAPIGGVMPIPGELTARGVPPHWMGYVCVTDVDASTAQALSLGGRALHPPMDIPTVGRFVTIADPQGAVLAMFTPEAQAPGHAGLPRIGDISWHELITTDRTAALDFYGALFGWRALDAVDMGEAGIYQMYGRDDAPMGGMFNTPPGVQMPPNWCYYVTVANADATAALIKQHGGQILHGPADVPGGGRIAQCMDPQGAVFAVHSMGAGE